MYIMYITKKIKLCIDSSFLEQTFSGNHNIFWECPSQDPPLFPGPRIQ